jgi:spore coat polysaccharide biosynthesis predicted glycosyltransferase SpsG
VGLGHLTRCTALAEALGESGFEVETRGLGATAVVELDEVRWQPWRPEAAASGPAPDLLVLDTYDRADWQRVAGLARRRLAAFADALPEPGAADVTIALESDAETTGDLLAGLRFACLRRPFWDLGPRAIRVSPQTVLVTSGGSDLGGLASRIASRLRERLPTIGLELVWGTGFGGEPPAGVVVLERPASLLEPLLRADAVVCTGGQTVLEAAASGVPALVLEGAPNQRRQIASLAERGAVLPVGEEEVPDALERLLGDSALRRRLSERAREAIDGRGALRAAAALGAISRR